MSFQHEHEKLWLWLSERPYKQKSDYFEAIPEERRPLHLCYACVEAVRRAEVDNPIVCIANMKHCEYCPIDWLADSVDSTDFDRLCPCCGTGSPYMQLFRTKRDEADGYEDTVKELCEKIASLPWCNPIKKEKGGQP